MRTTLRRGQLRQEQRRDEEGMVVQFYDAGQSLSIDADELQSCGLKVSLVPEGEAVVVTAS